MLHFFSILNANFHNGNIKYCRLRNLRALIRSTEVSKNPLWHAKVPERGRQRLTMRKHAPIITAFILTSRSMGNWMPKLSVSVKTSRRRPAHCLLILPILLISSMVRISRETHIGSSQRGNPMLRSQSIVWAERKRQSTGGSRTKVLIRGTNTLGRKPKLKNHKGSETNRGKEKQEPITQTIK